MHRHRSSHRPPKADRHVRHIFCLQIRRFLRLDPHVLDEIRDVNERRATPREMALIGQEAL